MVVKRVEDGPAGDVMRMHLHVEKAAVCVDEEGFVMDEHLVYDTLVCLH